MFTTSAVAQQHCTGPQIGTWKLQSFEAHDLKTGEKSEPLGAHPTGYITYGPDCRMQVIVTADGRKAPVNLVPTDAERIELYGGLEAYAGTYSIEVDIISHHIDASWNQFWTGRTQARPFKIDGNTLRIEAHGKLAAGQSNSPTGRETFSVITWTKVE